MKTILYIHGMGGGGDSRIPNHLRIHMDELLYIELTGHDMVFHTVREDISTYGTMKAMEQDLVPHGFFRCNNCYLVNLRFVEEINSASVILTGGVELPISRMKRKGFLDAFTASVHNTLILNEEKPTGGASDGRPE